ncbi:hypothetical protein KA005_19100 [bacterium]|nr:hypothetical protein [bacterium]
MFDQISNNYEFIMWVAVAVVGFWLVIRGLVWADCFLLVVDGYRQAMNKKYGHLCAVDAVNGLLDCSIDKLEDNKVREWGERNAEGFFEHVKNEEGNG